MKYLKHLVTAAAALLALTAILGAGSASAAPRFESDWYPKLIAGDTSEHTLVVDKGAVKCKGPSFWADLSAAESSLGTTTEDSTCNVFGSDTPLKMNGCKFTFSIAEKLADGTYKGSYAIGPEGCGPITVSLLNCKVSIPAQSGLAAKFENVAGSNTVKITSEAENIEYTQSGCSNSGTFSGGKYLGSWTASAYSAKSPSGAQIAPKNHVFSAGGKTVKCGEATFSLSSPGLASTRTITPEYKKCEAFGFLETNTSVAMNGCSYTVQATSILLPKASGTAGVSCPAEKAIEIQAVNCRIAIPAQPGVSGISLEELSTSTSVSANVSGLHYNVVKDGAGCPFNGLGSHADGSYTGATTLNDKLNAAQSWFVSGS